MMTRVTMLCVLVAAMGPFWSADAGATTRMTDVSGDSCQAHNPGDNVGWTEIGFENRCGNCTKDVFCPLPLFRDSDLPSTTVTVSSIEAHVTDFNSASNDFFCFPVLRDAFGGVAFGNEQFTPAGASTAEQTLFFADPFTNINIGTSARSVFLECFLPATGGFGNSKIESLRMVTNFQ